MAVSREEFQALAELGRQHAELNGDLAKAVGQMGEILAGTLRQLNDRMPRSPVSMYERQVETGLKLAADAMELVGKFKGVEIDFARFSHAASV